MKAIGTNLSIFVRAAHSTQERMISIEWGFCIDPSAGPAIRECGEGSPLRVGNLASPSWVLCRVCVGMLPLPRRSFIRRTHLCLLLQDGPASEPSRSKRRPEVSFERIDRNSLEAFRPWGKIFFDHRIGAVIVNRLEIFRFDAIPGKIIGLPEPRED
jgi:hypothetical protein